jgi:poly(3-hydroxybutyrate) depolymerase
MISTIDYACVGAVHVRLLRLHGAGHTIPQAYAEMPRMLGDTAGGIDIARYAWQFFRRAA